MDSKHHVSNENHDWSIPFFSEEEEEVCQATCLFLPNRRIIAHYCQKVSEEIRITNSGGQRARKWKNKLFLSSKAILNNLKTTPKVAVCSQKKLIHCYSSKGFPSKKPGSCMRPRRRSSRRGMRNGADNLHISLASYCHGAAEYFA